MVLSGGRIEVHLNYLHHASVGIWVTIIMYQVRCLTLFQGRAIMVLWFMLNCLLYDVND